MKAPGKLFLKKNVGSNFLSYHSISVNPKSEKLDEEKEIQIQEIP